jgi:hypothetical protein
MLNNSSTASAAKPVRAVLTRIGQSPMMKRISFMPPL